MANFTINSLGTSSVKDTDNFIKSDANGALSKINFADLKTEVQKDVRINFINDNSVKLTSEYGRISNLFTSRFGPFIAVSFEFTASKQVPSFQDVISTNFSPYGQQSVTSYNMSKNTPVNIVFKSKSIQFRNTLAVDEGIAVSCVIPAYMDAL
ncbi:hypothetical protein [Ligilactobacillus agilis]|uniref:hypothetical protein n=1 Tax=Ligilactobacillus agilis TaxID=1601 RepID=UPI00255C3FF8|nr:hypothetical protein [Ligilactobacillus agilis]